MPRLVPILVGALLVCAVAGMPLAAQDKKKDKKAEPAIKVILPLGAAAGQTTKLTIRGSKLDKATDVKVLDGKGTAKIASKGSAAVPDKNPEKVGDTQVVVDVTLTDKPGEAVSLVIVTPDGETKPHPLLVETKLPVVPEKEPNEGFKQFQEIKLPAVIEGTIGQPRDVDVFRLEGRAGQKVTAEGLAARYGSPLDAMLTLFNAHGQEIAAARTAAPDHTDPRLEATLPADGVYFLVLIDAHDTGSPVHAYRLVVK
jgi:hypothetical protein